MRRRPSGLSVCHVLRPVRRFLFGSVLRGRSRLPVSKFKRAYSSPRLGRPLLRPLLTVPACFASGLVASLGTRRLLSGGISPGKSALLPCTTSAFTSTGKPIDFAVLCQLVALYRPSMRCSGSFGPVLSASPRNLFIGSQVSQLAFLQQVGCRASTLAKKLKGYDLLTRARETVRFPV
jgi:hypothetical protein